MLQRQQEYKTILNMQSEHAKDKFKYEDALKPNAETHINRERLDNLY
jgi:hypothetical protein